MMANFLREQPLDLPLAAGAADCWASLEERCRELAHSLDADVTVVGEAISPRYARLAFGVAAEFAKRADALGPVTFGFGNAAIVPDEVDELNQAEAAVGYLVFGRAGGDAVLRVA